MPKRFLSALVCALAVTVLLCLPADAVETEQIQVSMPRVDVYVHTGDEALDTLPLEQISATLDGKALEVESFQPSEQGIFYIFMLDISRSIPAEHLAAAKQAVRDACGSLRPQDKVALLSFGNSVNVLSDGSEPVETVLTKLDALAGTDNNTQFYTAMDTLVEMATKVTDLRRCAVVFSDGIDDTDAGMSQAELENVLKQSGISVYAMCIDTAQQQNVDSFRDFIRLSGGELYTFGGSDGSAKLAQLLTQLNDVWLLQLLCPTEETPARQVSLQIQFGTLAEVSTELESDYWVADTTAPYVISATLDAGAKAVTVTFSEPISNGEDAGGYVLTDSAGTAMNIASAAYAHGDRRSVRLIVPEVRASGAYTIRISGQKDLSVNHNLLTAFEGTLSGGGAAEEQPSAPTTVQSATEESLARELRQLILFTVGAIALVAVLIVLIVRSHRGGETGYTGRGKSAKGKQKRMVRR